MPDHHERWSDNHRREPRAYGEAGRFNSDQARYYGADRNPAGGPWRAHDPAAGEREPWARERYGALYDEDRPLYGSGYGGQEYGVEGGPSHRERDERRPRDHRSDQALPYGDEPFPRDEGAREFGAPADYAYHPHAEDLLDPDYVDWRERRLAEHDRDYRAWRDERRRAYDDAYRRDRGRR